MKSNNCLNKFRNTIGSSRISNTPFLANSPIDQNRRSSFFVMKAKARDDDETSESPDIITNIQNDHTIDTKLDEEGNQNLTSI